MNAALAVTSFVCSVTTGPGPKTDSEDWKEVEDLLDRIASQTSGSHGKSAGARTCTSLHPHLYWHCHACPLGSVYLE